MMTTKQDTFQMVEALEWLGEMDGLVEQWLGDAFNSWLPGAHKLELRTASGYATVSAGDIIVKRRNGQCEVVLLDTQASMEGQLKMTPKQSEKVANIVAASRITMNGHHRNTPEEVAVYIATALEAKDDS